MLRENLRSVFEVLVFTTGLAWLMLSGCGGSSGNPTTAVTSAVITPYKGAFAPGSTISIKDANGNPVTLLTGGTISASGVANVSFNASVTYPLLIEVSGSYYNEVTGQIESASSPLRSVVPTAADAISIPVTLVTEIAVADMLTQHGGNPTSANPAQSTAATSSLERAGTIFGIPASAVPSFDPSSNTTSDPDTIRLSALAVVADSLGAGPTLADKVNSLANTLANLSPASAPSDVIPQGVVTAAMSSVTSGASSVLAAGASAPSEPQIPTTILYRTSELAGTWVIHRLQAGRTLDTTTGSNTNNWNHHLQTVDANGNAVTSSEVTNGNTANSATWSAQMSADGTITEAGVASTHATMSPSRDLVVETLNSGNGLDRRLVIWQKIDPAVTFSVADLAGTWVAHRLQAGRTQDTATGANTNNWNHHIEIFDANGNATTSSEVTNGSPAASGTWTAQISADGTITEAIDASTHATMSASKDLIVMTRNSGNGLDRRLVVLQKRDAAVTYTATDLVGTWVGHRLQTGRTLDTITGANNNNWSHNIETIDANGNAVSSSEVTSNGPGPGATWTAQISTDGTITDPNDPALHCTMSTSKALMVCTLDNGNGLDRRLVLLQKRR